MKILFLDNILSKELKYREKVGLVFQFPESQLFAETVLADVAWTTKFWGTYGQSGGNSQRKELAIVGLEESIYDKSPFEITWWSNEMLGEGI